MSQIRAQKAKEVEDLKASLSSSEMLVVTHNNGLTVKQVTELRTKLRAEGAAFQVAKNTLVRRALEGTKYAELAPLFKGPVGIAYSKEPLVAARVAHAFAKDNDKLVIMGGAMSGEILDVAKVKQLALLPSLDVLRAKIAAILYAPGAQLARLANAYAEKGGASAPAAAAPAPEAAAETPASA